MSVRRGGLQIFRDTPSGAAVVDALSGAATPFGTRATGGFQAATGRGYLGGNAVIQAPGSAGSSATLIDGTSSAGRVLATIPLSQKAIIPLPNVLFSAALFITVSGTRPGLFSIPFHVS